MCEHELRAQPDLLEVGALAGDLEAGRQHVQHPRVADEIPGLPLERIPVAVDGGAEETVSARRRAQPARQMDVDQSLPVPVMVDALPHLPFRIATGGEQGKQTAQPRAQQRAPRREGGTRTLAAGGGATSPACPTRRARSADPRTAVLTRPGSSRPHDPDMPPGPTFALHSE